MDHQSPGGSFRLPGRQAALLASWPVAFHRVWCLTLEPRALFLKFHWGEFPELHSSEFREVTKNRELWKASMACQPTVPDQE